MIILDDNGFKHILTNKFNNETIVMRNLIGGGILTYELWKLSYAMLGISFYANGSINTLDFSKIDSSDIPILRMLLDLLFSE